MYRYIVDGNFYKQVSNNKLTAVAFADTHTYNNRHLSRYHQMQDMIDKEHPDILIVLGDFLDFYVEQAHVLASLLATLSWFTYFGNLVKDNIDVYIITGNHDPTYSNTWIQQLVKESGVHICRSLVIEGPKNGIEFRHGDEFDWIWSGIGFIPGINRFAWWLLDKHPRIAIKAREILGWFGGFKTPRDEKPEKYDQHVANIRMRAKERFDKTGNTPVFGHTHSRYADAYMYNVGAVEDQAQYAVIWDIGDGYLGGGFTFWD